MSSQQAFALLTTAAFQYGFSRLEKKLLGKNRGIMAARDVSSSGTQQHQQIIYGECRVAGHVIFYGTSGAQNGLLWYVYAMAGHQCEALGDIWLGEHYIPATSVNPSTGVVDLPHFNRSEGPYLHVWKFLGTHDQNVGALLASNGFPEWSASNHRGAGIACLVVSMYRSDSVWPNGAPGGLQCLVKGKRVYDPRLDSTNGGSGSHRVNDATTWSWSDNTALHARDYYTSGSKYFSTPTPLRVLGLGRPDSRILDSATADAADACDELVDIPAGANVLQLIPVSRFMRVSKSGTAVTFSGYGSLSGLGASVQDLVRTAYCPTAETSIDVFATGLEHLSYLGVTSNIGAVVDNVPNSSGIRYEISRNVNTLEIWYWDGSAWHLVDTYGSIDNTTELRLVYNDGELEFLKDDVSIETISISGSLHLYIEVWLQNHSQSPPLSSITVFPAPSSDYRKEKRYTCNVVLSAGAPHHENVGIILASMLGQVSRSGGKLRIHAGQYEAPVVALTADDILGRMSISTHRSDDDNYNAVGAAIYDENKNWQLSSIPTRTQSAYQTADGGRKDKVVDLQAVRGNYRAQRITEGILRQSRQKRVITFHKLSRRAARIRHNDMFTLTYGRTNDTAQLMRCLRFKNTEDGFVSITARAESASLFDDMAPGDYIDPEVNSLTNAQLETPSSPTGLTITAFPTYLKIAVTGLWRSGTIIKIWEHTSSSPFSSATVVAQGVNQMVFSIPKRDTITRYYWATADFNGQTSEEYPTGAGISGAADLMQTEDIEDNGVTIPSFSFLNYSIINLTSGGNSGDYCEVYVDNPTNGTISVEYSYTVTVTLMSNNGTTEIIRSSTKWRGFRDSNPSLLLVETDSESDFVGSFVNGSYTYTRTYIGTLQLPAGDGITMRLRTTCVVGIGTPVDADIILENARFRLAAILR